MKRTLILGLVFLLCLGSALAEYTDDLQVHYGFRTLETNITDSTPNGNDMSVYNFAWVPDGIFGGAGSFELGQGGRMPAITASDYSACAILNFTEALDTSTLLWGSPADFHELDLGRAGNTIRNYLDTPLTDDWTQTFSENQWNAFCIVNRVGTNIEIFINGTSIGNRTNTDQDWDDNTRTLGNNPALTRDFGGLFAQFQFWNRSIEYQEVLQHWNDGKFYDPYLDNFSISATDLYDDSPINSFSADIPGHGTFYTSSGLIVTSLSRNNSLHDITINSTDYFPRVYNNYNISVQLDAEIFQAELLVIPREAVTNNSVSGGNLTAGSQTVNNGKRLKVRPPTTTVTFQHENYSTTTSSFNLAPLSNGSVYMYVGNTLINLTAINPFQNVSISKFTVFLFEESTGFNADESTTTGNVQFGMLQNYTYNLSITAPGYVGTSILLSPKTDYSNYTFELLPENSLQINIFDEATGNKILQNVSVQFSSNFSEFTNYTSTGYLTAQSLFPSPYYVLFSTGNYSNRTYIVTVGDQTTQVLNAYLTASSSTTLFTVYDADATSIAITEAMATMYRFIDGSWTAVESKLTDITGKAQFTYTTNVNYRFLFSKTGFNDNIFYLNPILFDNYDIKLSKSVLLDYVQDYDKISILYSPQSFDNNATTEFNLLISSPSGLFTEYGFNLTYPGGSVASLGFNAIGEQLTSDVNITGATIFDTVTLDYYYISSTSGRRNFTILLPINTVPSNFTFLANREQTHGLGVFERIFIITILILLIVGIASLAGQPIPGLALAALVFGYMTYIGFVELWLILPSMFVIVFILIWKSGG